MGVDGDGWTGTDGSRTYLRMSFLLKKVQSCKGKTHTQSLASPRIFPPLGSRRLIPLLLACPAPGQEALLPEASVLAVGGGSVYMVLSSIHGQMERSPRCRLPGGTARRGAGRQAGARALGPQLQRLAILSLSAERGSPRSTGWGNPSISLTSEATRRAGVTQGSWGVGQDRRGGRQAGRGWWHRDRIKGGGCQGPSDRCFSGWG